jgi:signal transduction histidine kinase
MAYNHLSHTGKFMKKTESNSAGKSTAFSEDQACLNDVFQEILPVIFHKLKNKLTPILGYSQILRSKVSDDFCAERLVKIESSASELTAQFNVLKEYVKAEPALQRPGSINDIVKCLKPRLRQMAAAGKIKILFALDPKIPEIPLHAGQIRLLLLNLAANAIQALQAKTAPAKEIRLKTCLAEGAVRLTLRDNGIGMAAEELDVIWTPFYSRFPGQVGLGLTLCERIIANHAALCRVASQPGEFSEFEIRFPLARPSARTQDKSADIDPRSQS